VRIKRAPWNAPCTAADGDPVNGNTGQGGVGVVMVELRGVAAAKFTACESGCANRSSGEN
jgi:hypothetical protein